MLNYSDIPSSAIDDVCDCVKEEEYRYNLAGDRVIIKWDGFAEQCILDVCGAIRNHADAKVYYSDPANGWAIESDI